MKIRRPFISGYLDTLRNRWRANVTPGGKWLIGTAFLSGLGAVSVTVPVYQIFCAVAALLVVAEIAGFLWRPKVTVSGELPKRTSVSQPVTGELTVTNRSRWPIYDFSLAFFELPDALQELDRERMVPVLRSGESISISITLQSLRRGLYELPGIRPYTTFPFNVCRSGWSRVPVGSLLVLPSFHRLSNIDISLGTRYQPGGIVLTSHVGESPEYIGNREYVPGEPARRLDFRSWARLGRPVVREYHEEYYCRIALVLDTFVPPEIKAGTAGFPNLEAAVSLAASIADALSGGEHLIDIFAAGPELYVFRAGRHTAHLENVLEILACVGACRRSPFDTIAPTIADELGNISTTICVFLDWDQPRRQLARTALEAGCRLKVLIVRDGPTTMPVDSHEISDISQYSIASIRDGSMEVL